MVPKSKVPQKPGWPDRCRGRGFEISLARLIGGAEFRPPPTLFLTFAKKISKSGKNEVQLKRKKVYKKKDYDVHGPPNLHLIILL